MVTASPSPGLTVTAPEPQGLWQIFLLILYLVLILVGVYYATRLFARIAQQGFVKTGKKKGTGRSIYLIDRLAFDREKSILLIEEGERRYLLGVTPQNITLLKEYDAPPYDESEEEQQGDSAKFSDVLTNFTKVWKH